MATLAAIETVLKRAGVEIIDENGGGPGVRLRRQQQDEALGFSVRDERLPRRPREPRSVVLSPRSPAAYVFFHQRMNAVLAKRRLDEVVRFIPL